MSKAKSQNSANIITDEVTAHVADLIKLRIPRNQLTSYTSQLNTVLSSVKVLAELDTSQVKISAQTHGLENVLRDDKAAESLDMSEYKNTKNFKNNYFVVEKVL